ncbi:MAG: glycosyltransferase family 39 protein [Solirubrobacterales bacterium]|nr:glycosyltransferase family 39 protein [Solirubrobacterales bacterium]
MATYASRPLMAVRLRALGSSRAELAGIALGVCGLIAVSLLLRTRNLGVGYWVDEGLSVGIADRPLLDIPGVMRLDGSPPLYYMVLHVWMALTGSTGEATTHGLSLLFAVLTVPSAVLLARSLFGIRAGWIAGVLAAMNPFITQYAQETRMYALVILLGTVATGAYVAALIHRRRAMLPVFSLALAALLYTHNWALFFAASLGLVWLCLVVFEPRAGRRALLRDGVLGFGGALILYAPWLPTLLFQAGHTGAPWSRPPDLQDLTEAFSRLLGPVEQVALLLAGGVGIAAIASRKRLDAEARSAVALASISALTIAFAWGASQVSPAWAGRYFAVALPPLLLLCALGLARAKRLGLVGLALVAIMWSGTAGRSEKSNVRSVTASLAPSLRPGDLVVSAQPEQLPVLAHYLPDNLRWATLWGPVEDLGVTDWRDGVERLEQTSATRDLRPLVDALAPGQRIVLVEPMIYALARWSAPWTSLVRVRSEEWSRALSNDERLRVSAIYPPSPFPEHPNPVQATVMIKGGARG